MKLFNKVFDSLPQVSWHRLFEQTRLLRGSLIKVHLAVAYHLTFEGAVCSLKFARKVFVLTKKSGVLFMSLYIKQCAVSLQRYYAGSYIKGESSSVWVKLSRAGIPVIIPTHHRHIIARGGERADYLVKLYLSWFSLCRVVLAAAKVTKATFSSITSDPKWSLGVHSLAGQIERQASILIERYVPWIRSEPMNLGIRWIPTWKSVPNSAKRVERLSVDGSIFSSFKYEFEAFVRSLDCIGPWEQGPSPLQLWSNAVIYPLDCCFTGSWLRRRSCEQLVAKDPGVIRVSEDPFNGLVFEPSLCESSEPPDFPFGISGIPGVVFGCELDPPTRVQRFCDDSAPEGTRLCIGRLACTLQGAGKRRIFAIGNYVRQRLLHPVHDWAMRVLSRLPADGTFRQEAPLHRLRAKRPMNLFSFDLSSATDRWPAAIIYSVVKAFFGDVAAECIVYGTLASHSFAIGPPLVKGKEGRSIRFEVGQPLGYYGSWALFSLSHHFMVWLAALNASSGTRSPFSDYALLGDDIVIANEAVAEEYLRLLDTMGVSISVTKSLISRTGALEFAKQFWVRGVQVNLSPVSVKAINSVHTFLGLCHTAEVYGLPFPVVLRLAGAGYKVRARMHSSRLSKRWLRLKVISDRSYRYKLLPIEWFIGRANPLNPYLKGIMVVWVLARQKPVELRLPPDEHLGNELDIEVVECTLYSEWVKSWLRYVQWHAEMTVHPNPSLEDLLSPPIVTTTWRRPDPDRNERKRFGLLWELWDMADGWTLGTCPPCLTAGRDELARCRTDFVCSSLCGYHPYMVVR